VEKKPIVENSLAANAQSGIFGRAYLDFTRERPDDEVRRYDDRLRVMAEQLAGNAEEVEKYVGAFGAVLKKRREAEKQNDVPLMMRSESQVPNALL
jgi:hypothetical protein